MLLGLLLGEWGEMLCHADIDCDGFVGSQEHRGYYPPLLPGQELRLWGLDPDGKAAARAMFVGDSEDKPSPGPKVVHNPICQRRLVAIPTIKSFPSSGTSEDIMVLGIATFAIAKWDRIANPDCGDALAIDKPGEACGAPGLVSNFGCGMDWGYLIEGGVQPPHFLLQRISENDNGLAPNMIALVE